jgi:3-oxoadipate enol-lactonase
MPVANVRGIPIHYHERGVGSGPPLVLSHGLMGCVHKDEPVQKWVNLVARERRVVAYDARGHGSSGHTADPGDYTWEALAEDLHALLEVLAIERAHLAGGSLGAGISAMVALRHPEAVASLLLFGPPPVGEEWDDWARDGLRIRAAVLEREGVQGLVALHEALPPTQQRRAEDPAWWEWERRWLLAQNVEGIIACHLGLAEGPAIPLGGLSEIQAPALLVGHPDDPQHPQATVELLASRLPRAEVVLEPSEAWADDHPEERAATVLGFLRRVDAQNV